jgi:hypothetical protein
MVVGPSTTGSSMYTTAVHPLGALVATDSAAGCGMSFSALPRAPSAPTWLWCCRKPLPTSRCACPFRGYTRISGR